MASASASFHDPPWRAVSGLERIWLVIDRLGPPFVSHMVIEGDGSLPLPGREVVARLAEAVPGFRARLVGHLMWSRFVGDGPLPAVREVTADWDGAGPEGAPFLRTPLDPRQGPTSEIVVVRGRGDRLVLRTHHGLTDGKGMILMARALFAALRGEPVPRAEMGPLNDLSLARSLGVTAERILPSNSAAPQGPAEGTSMGMTWGRRRVAGKFKRFLPSLILALARMRPIPEGQSFRVVVPVDLRPHAGGVVSTANLTGLLGLPIQEHLNSAEPLAAIAAALAEGVARRDAARGLLSAAFARAIPLRLMAAVGRRGARRALEEGRYDSSAVVSNLGRVDVASLSCPGFEARRCFFVPPANPALPVFLAISGDDAGVELCMLVPECLATRGRLGELLDIVERALVTAA